MIETKCQMCTDGIVYSIKGSGKFCNDCKVVRDKARKRKFEEKSKAEGFWNKKKRERLAANFKSLNLSNEDLFPKNFNKISNISAQSYMKVYKARWLDVLEVFGLKEVCFNVMLETYYQRFTITGAKSLGVFLKDIGITYTQITEEEKTIFWDKVEMNSRTIRDDNAFEENFLYVCNIVGDIPHYNEFMEYTKISFPTYASRLGLTGSSRVYDQIVEKYVTPENYNRYKEKRMNHKVQVGRENHQGNKYTNEDLELEFRRVYDYHIESSGKTPSNDTFDKISKIDNSVYRHRFGISFGEVAEMYGYEIDNSHRTEYAVIKTLNEILGEDAAHQKQFDWLLSTKQYPLRCDAYYPSYNLIFEYDGEQHTQAVEHWGGEEGLEITQANDHIKNTLIPQHNLKLIRIAYDEPYHDVDYLKLKLIEHGIIPPNHTVITDSTQAVKSAS